MKRFLIALLIGIFATCTAHAAQSVRIIGSDNKIVFEGKNSVVTTGEDTLLITGEAKLISVNVTFDGVGIGNMVQLLDTASSWSASDLVFIAVASISTETIFFEPSVPIHLDSGLYCDITSDAGQAISVIAVYYQ